MLIEIIRAHSVFYSQKPILCTRHVLSFSQSLIRFTRLS